MNVDAIDKAFFARIAEALEASSKPVAKGEDILEYIDSLSVVNEKGLPFDFDSDHVFLAQIMRDMSPRQVIRKCSQVGLSTSLFLKEMAIAKLFSYSIIHTMPTIALLQFFVAQKVEQVIRNNKRLSTLIDSKYSGKQRKKVGYGWILFLGTKGENEEISHTSDLNVYDEYDKSEQGTLDAMRSRLKASHYGGIWIVGNPEVADGGVDLAYENSDAKHWFIRCSRCNHWFYLDFFSCVDLERRCFICPRCRRRLRDEDRRKGIWVRKWRGREVSGYWINHLMAPWISAESIIEDYETMPQELFYTYCLGMAPPHGDARISAELILQAVSGEKYEPQPCYAGVDVGSKFHVVIGNKDGVYALEVLENHNDSGWDQLDSLIDRYGVRLMVIDRLPSPEEALALARRHPGRVYVQAQTRDSKVSTAFHFPVGPDPVVHVDRNDAISYAVKLLQTGKIKFYFSGSHPLFASRNGNRGWNPDCFVAHATCLTKEKIEDASGNVRYRWKASPKRDHFFMAFVYYLAARAKDEQVSVVYPVERAKGTTSAEWRFYQRDDDAWYYV